MADESDLCLIKLDSEYPHDTIGNHLETIECLLGAELLARELEAQPSGARATFPRLG